MLLARHSQHTGGGQCEEERPPFTLIHSPLFNECIGAPLEPHPEMCFLWGSSSVGYGDPGMVMAVLSETVGVREAVAEGAEEVKDV